MYCALKSASSFGVLGCQDECHSPPVGWSLFAPSTALPGIGLPRPFGSSLPCSVKYKDQQAWFLGVGTHCVEAPGETIPGTGGDCQALASGPGEGRLSLWKVLLC